MSRLSGKEYSKLEALLLRADVGGVGGGLGYSGAVKAHTDQPLARLLGCGRGSRTETQRRGANRAHSPDTLQVVEPRSGVNHICLAPVRSIACRP